MLLWIIRQISDHQHQQTWGYEDGDLGHLCW